MGKTKISWCDAVWNPVVGCTPISGGCKNCYARRLHDMRHRAYLAGKHVPAQYARPFSEVQLLEDRLEDPLHWRKPQRIFVNSVSDLFHPDVPYGFIDRVFAVMGLCSQHTFLVLTKRPERMSSWFLQDISGTTRRDWVCSSAARILNINQISCPNWPLPNVWIGVTVEDQKTADERIPDLLETPAVVRFISYEPALGPVNLKPAEIGRWPDMSCWMPNKDEWDDWKYWMHKENGIQWVILGGESGPNARPMHPDWARSVRDQCVDAGVPFLFKQWGEWLHENQIYDRVNSTDLRVLNAEAYRVLMRGPNELVEGYIWVDGSISYFVGKKTAGRLLDGVEYTEYPEVQP